MQHFVPVRRGEGLVCVPDAKGGSGGLDKVEAVLTKQQKEAWKKRTGEPIDFEKLNLYGSSTGYSTREVAMMPAA